MKQPQPFLPRHRAIYEILRGRIRSRYWKYGEALPSREALCREFAVSAITIRTALRNLQRDGFVHSIRGRGTFACWKKEQEYYLSAAPTAVRKLEITHLLFAPKPADSYPNTFANVSRVSQVMGNFKRMDANNHLEKNILDNIDQD